MWPASRAASRGGARRRGGGGQPGGQVRQLVDGSRAWRGPRFGCMRGQLAGEVPDAHRASPSTTSWRICSLPRRRWRPPAGRNGWRGRRWPGRRGAGVADREASSSVMVWGTGMPSGLAGACPAVPALPARSGLRGHHRNAGAIDGDVEHVGPGAGGSGTSWREQIASASAPSSAKAAAPSASAARSTVTVRPTPARSASRAAAWRTARVAVRADISAPRETSTRSRSPARRLWGARQRALGALVRGPAHRERPQHGIDRLARQETNCA